MATTLSAVTAMETARQKWERRRETIKLLADYLGFKTAELARRMEMNRSTMTGRLNGSTQVEPWELAGFAAVFGVPVEVLEMDPEDAIRWVLDNPSGIIRNRCYAEETLQAA